MYPTIRQFLDSVALEFDQIPTARKGALEKLGAYYESSDSKAFTFICTHNSRRSHLGQVWAAVAADYYGLAPIASYSGGTEATATYKSVIASLNRIGFEIEGSQESNPRYNVKWSGEKGVSCWSKVYADAANPSTQFCAVMTCTHADEGCPIVQGATTRISLPYIDPKVSDGSATEALTYDARCRQIAREMLYAFSTV